MTPRPCRVLDNCNGPYIDDLHIQVIWNLLLQQNSTPHSQICRGIKTQMQPLEQQLIACLLPAEEKAVTQTQMQSHKQSWVACLLPRKATLAAKGPGIAACLERAGLSSACRLAAGRQVGTAAAGAAQQAGQA